MSQRSEVWGLDGVPVGTVADAADCRCARGRDLGGCSETLPLAHLPDITKLPQKVLSKDEQQKAMNQMIEKGQTHQAEAAQADRKGQIACSFDRLSPRLLNPSVSHVIEEFHRVKAPAALRVRRGQPPQGGRPRARRRHHRSRHGQPRHAHAPAHRRQAGRDGQPSRAPTATRPPRASRACARRRPPTTRAASA